MIVDRHITRRHMTDFYLEAHTALKDKATPARYEVIRDEIGFEANELETFTNSQYYLPTRDKKAAYVVAPVYWATSL
ncbi:hypothetical protein LTR17_001512 [Elasticomyces elasticus]|nr:hypothetical protein LTR17_001512 [Elasticomyces elasticus]